MHNLVQILTFLTITGKKAKTQRFFSVTEVQRKATVKSKKWFLKCCDCFKVVPVTLSVNKQHQPPFTGRQEIKWQEAEIF